MRLIRAATVLGLLALASCNHGPQEPESENGKLSVLVQVSGGDLDVDGFDILVDGESRLHVDLNRTAVIEDLAPGTHTVALGGVASNCDVTGSQPRKVVVSRGETVGVTLAVECFATGVQIQMSTVGLDPDLNGYSVKVGDAPAVQVFSSGAGIVSRLSPGIHGVSIGDFTPNCRAAAGNPSQVQVTPRSVVTITLEVECVAATGHLEVTVAFSGIDPDPDGYTVQIGTSPPIDVPSAGQPAGFPGVSPGDHTVRVSGITSNCTVDDREQTVHVTAGTLTRDTVRVVFPAPCTRADKLVFTRWPSGPPHWGYDPFVMIAYVDGSNVSELAGGTSPAWAPDGTQVVFVRVQGSCYYGCASSGLYVINSDRTGLRALTTNSADGAPAWSPDGNTIAFSNNGGLHLLDLATSSRSAIPNLPVTFVWDPAWSPDGTRLAFSCTLGIQADLCVVNRDGTGFERLTTGADYEGAPSWHPDGSRIAYHASHGMTSDIMVMTIGGDRSTIRLASGTTPAWSGDGNRIFFNGSPLGLYAMNADGSGVVQLSTGADFGPRWRP
jgi:Tol biopolymer transport system component